ncbi:MAG TPA: hypothetical protein VGS21_00735, partial [Acidimicrobiales bacterium]|nr:hypothetical protein [Acidimicrobiales bacterium]
MVAPDGAPVSGDLVTFWTYQTTTPTRVGSATTNLDGLWSFTPPAYAELPAIVQALVNTNGGYLNIFGEAAGTAEVNGTSYRMIGLAATSAWVGDDSATAPPQQSLDAEPANITLRPADVASESAEDTPAAEEDTWASEHDPTTAGNAAYAYETVPTDSYGFQEIGGDGSYDPNIAADGTDLGHAEVSATDTSACGMKVISQQTGWRYTILGEYHSWTDSAGAFTYTTGASSSIGWYFSLNGGAFSFGGDSNFTDGGSIAMGATPVRDDAHQFVVAFNYVKDFWEYICPGQPLYPQTTISENGIYNPGGGFVVFKDGADVSQYDGIG